MQALWMILAAFLFASMGVCVKIASNWFTMTELVFWRGVIGMIFLALLARRQGVRLGTQYPGMHVWRSVIGVFSLGAWFYAIAGMPLATAMTLNYMSSVWIAAFLVGGALLAWVPLRGRDGRVAPPPLQVPLVMTVLVGFGGVVLVLRPSVGADQGLAGLSGLLSGMTAAFAYMQVIALSRIGEPETRTVFYFAMGSAVFGGLGTLITGMSPWDWGHALWLLPVGLLAAGGQLCMTRAYSSARTSAATLVVANLQYSGIIFAALYSLLLFKDPIDGLAWAGMALIIVSGIAATVLRQRAVPKAPAEEH
ncbi:DMT family transporter [Variovorax dokdonensis]|uniref:DMT family transporter n=1 Tax=Variovorax dokdonensis TaxID=344883 RepID=A0ABT7NC14_9BURK|nr:DMT family transporter [Variovorax dokdonensis]MDM0045468.1 DMT family transporter [Variovorax dokdonensis]